MGATERLPASDMCFLTLFIQILFQLPEMRHLSALVSRGRLRHRPSTWAATGDKIMTPPVSDEWWMLRSLSRWCWQIPIWVACRSHTSGARRIIHVVTFFFFLKLIKSHQICVRSVRGGGYITECFQLQCTCSLIVLSKWFWSRSIPPLCCQPPFFSNQLACVKLKTWISALY